MGVLGAGTSRKRGPRCGHTPKRGGGLRNVHNPKSGTLGTSLVKERILRTEVTQKGVLGAYLSHIFTLTCQYDLQTKKRGLRNGRNQKRVGGLRGAPNYLYWTYMRVPPHNVGSGTTEKYGTWNLL